MGTRGAQAMIAHARSQGVVCRRTGGAEAGIPSRRRALLRLRRRRDGIPAHPGDPPLSCPALGPSWSRGPPEARIVLISDRVCSSCVNARSRPWCSGAGEGLRWPLCDFSLWHGDGLGSPRLWSRSEHRPRCLVVAGLLVVAAGQGCAWVIAGRRRRRCGRHRRVRLFCAERER